MSEHISINRVSHPEGVKTPNIEIGCRGLKEYGIRTVLQKSVGSLCYAPPMLHSDASSKRSKRTCPQNVRDPIT